MDYIGDLRRFEMTNGGGPHKENKTAEKPGKPDLKDKPVNEPDNFKSGKRRH